MVLLEIHLNIECIWIEAKLDLLGSSSRDFQMSANAIWEVVTGDAHGAWRRSVFRARAGHFEKNEEFVAIE